MPESIPVADSVADSVDTLEATLGDPWDRDNPLGFEEILAADERQVMFEAGEKALDSLNLNAEFVPVAQGGRLSRADHFIQVMRAVFRRDPCLGLGYGFASFIASCNVWAAGDAVQRRRMAELLLGNGKVAAAYHELAHGNDMTRTRCTAVRAGENWRLTGRKEVVSNLQRADAMVLFARTDPAVGGRSHTQFLLPKADLNLSALRYLPRFPSSGMRGVQLGGAEFDGLLVPGDSLLGAPGDGLATALSSFQMTRTAMPGMLVGVVDTGLRAAVSCATRRRLYGGAVADLPYVRHVLARVFTDLLIADAFSRAVTRSLHLLPDETSVSASAVKYLASGLLMSAMNDLSTVLGAQSYLREGPYAIFQKLWRDLAPIGFGHASRAACQATVLPQLPRLARRSWLTHAQASADLFRMATDLPALRFDALVPGAPGTDTLCAALIGISEQLEPGQLRDQTAVFREELVRLRHEAIALRPAELTIDASPAAFALTDRYATVLAAASCLGMWWHNRDSADPFLSDEIWVRAALHRLHRRLRGPGLPHLPADTEDLMAGEMFRRHDSRQMFDLGARMVPG